MDYAPSMMLKLLPTGQFTMVTFTERSSNDVETGEHAIKVIVDAQGLPLFTSDQYELEISNPTLFISPTASAIRNISLSF